MPDHDAECARLEAEIAVYKARIQAMFYAKSYDDMTIANGELRRLILALNRLRNPSVSPPPRRKQP